MKKKITLLLFLLIFIMFTSAGCGCKRVDSDIKAKMEPIELEYWRVWDGPETFEPIIAKYRELHPFVKINYRQLRYEEYEQKLLEAFASDRAPDMFTIHNTWTRRYKNRGWITKMPSKTVMAYPEVKGSIKKEVVPTLKTQASPSLNYLRENFVDVVYDDIVINSKDPDTGLESTGVYGLPMAVDTLIMFVNRDLFNNAGITKIPEYWDKEFQQTVRKLSKQDNKGNIIQAGAALGGGNNIERSSDILSLLMMQNGAEMMNLDNTKVTFNLNPSDMANNAMLPGEDAFRFYTDYANPAKEVYTWNTSMENSLDLFIRGKVAIMFGYSYMIPQIKSGNPKMNLVVTKIPQIPGNTPVNYANYWIESVASKSKYQNEAWDFLLFATKIEQAASYLDATNKITAIRSMVDRQKENLELSAYVEQALTAKSWYKGNDAGTAEEIFRDTIDDVIDGELTMRDAIEESAKKIQQTIKAPLY